MDPEALPFVYAQLSPARSSWSGSIGQAAKRFCQCGYSNLHGNKPESILLACAFALIIALLVLFEAPPSFFGSFHEQRVELAHTIGIKTRIPRLIDREQTLPLDKWTVQRLMTNLTWSEPVLLDTQVDAIASECGLLAFHTGTPAYMEDHRNAIGPLLELEADWLSSQMNNQDGLPPCLMILGNQTELPRFHKLFMDMDVNETKESLAPDKFKSRYHAALALTEIAMKREEMGLNNTVALSQKYPLFAMYHDFDLVYSNKSRTFEALLERVDRGVRRFHEGGDTLETRVCRDWRKLLDERSRPVDWDDEAFYLEYRRKKALVESFTMKYPILPPEFPCDWIRIEEMRKQLRSLEDIAFFMSFDNFISSSWMVNAGVQFYQIGTPTAKFILESELYTINNMRLRHSYDHSDQGHLAYIFNQTFRINFDILPWVDKWGNNEYSFWGPSSDGDEIVALGMLDIDAAQANPHYRLAAKHWLKNHPNHRDALGVAVLNPRWMNSPGCRMGFRHGWRYRVFYCGDMVAHFNGCPKTSYGDFEFREKIFKECSNSSDFPARKNKDGTPFTWSEFLNESRNTVPKKNETKIKHFLELLEDAAKLDPVTAYADHAVPSSIH